MKKLITLFIALFALQGLLAQDKFVMTSQGLRSVADDSKSYVVVEIENTSAQELYARAIKYINENYKSPNDVIKGRTEGEFLKYHTSANLLVFYKNTAKKEMGITAKYITELKFKDGRVRFEMSSPEWSTTAAKLFKMAADDKNMDFPINANNAFLEYINDEIVKLTSYLNGETLKQDDEW